MRVSGLATDQSACVRDPVRELGIAQHTLLEALALLFRPTPPSFSWRFSARDWERSEGASLLDLHNRILTGVFFDCRIAAGGRQCGVSGQEQKGGGVAGGGEEK